MMANKADMLLQDIRENHLPRVQEGLEKGYIDENQILVIYDHAVRIRILQEEKKVASEPPESGGPVKRAVT